MAKIIGKLETTDKDGIAVDIQNVGMYTTVSGSTGDQKKVVMLLDEEKSNEDYDGDGNADPRINRELLRGYFESEWYEF